MKNKNGLILTFFGSDLILEKYLLYRYSDIKKFEYTLEEAKIELTNAIDQKQNEK